MFIRNRAVIVSAAILSVLTCAASAQHHGGKVIPSWATPKGYSLADMARATAVYNTGIQSGNPLTPPPPCVPFQILEADVTLDPGTMLYIPVYYYDNSGGAPAGFPTHVADQRADAKFLASVVLGLYGVTDFIIQVDGHTTILDDDYTTGTKTAPLLDGTPAGDEYIVAAAFVTPLRHGDHTVGIGGMIGGSPVVFVSYKVTVR
jgi:hypothetical protein